MSYEPGRALEAEGSRVALVTCQECGAALLVDPANSFDVFKRHDEWHARLDNAERLARSR